MTSEEKKPEFKCIENIVSELDDLTVSLQGKHIIGILNLSDEKTADDYTELFAEMPESLKSGLTYRYVYFDTHDLYLLRIKFNSVDSQTPITVNSLETRKQKVQQLQSELRTYTQTIPEFNVEAYQAQIVEDTDSKLVVEVPIEEQPLHINSSYLKTCDELYIDRANGTARYVFTDTFESPSDLEPDHFEKDYNGVVLEDRKKPLYDVEDWTLMCPDCKLKTVLYDNRVSAANVYGTERVATLHCRNCATLTVVYTGKLEEEFDKYKSLADVTHSFVSDLHANNNSLPESKILSHNAPDVQTQYESVFESTHNGTNYQLVVGDEVSLSWTDSTVRYTLPLKKDEEFPEEDDNQQRNMFCYLCGTASPQQNYSQIKPKRMFVLDETLYSTQKNTTICDDCAIELRGARQTLFNEHQTELLTHLI